MAQDSHPSGADLQSKTKAKRRSRVIHSCLECRRRKMKCDRGTPCENCKTAGRLCDYVNPASDDAVFREKLNEMKEAKDALDGALVDGNRREDMLQAMEVQQRKRARSINQESSDYSENSSDDGYLEPTPLAVQDAAYGDIEDDVDGLGVRIGRMCLGERIGGLYRPRIADEVASSLRRREPGRSPFATPESTPPPNSSALVPSDAVLFGHSNSDESPMRYIPARDIADSLLQRYWLAVHPVARVVHRPSFAQRYETLWECVENGVQTPSSLAAIVFSVLFSAVASMSGSETLAISHTPRPELLRQLKAGTELALNQAHLLRTTKIETLQALVVYMLPLCIDQISRAHSVLAGTMVRLAECMGLHRDPTDFGFSGTECHIRRLIWYQVCYIDLKTSLIQGPRPFIHHDGYTTQLPLDITTTSGSGAWNDAILSMIRFECNSMQRRCLAHRNRIDQRRMTITKAISKIEEFRIAMDAKYGPYIYCSSPTPMQRMAALVLKLMVSMLYLHPLHRYMNSVTYRLPDRLRQIVLMKGTESLEIAVELETAPDLKPWAWYSLSYQQYHTAFLLLVEVFSFPRRREASRLWRCFDFIFAEPLAVIPPLTVQNPTIDEIIEHRSVKARYLLTVISDRMREYNHTKRSKLPSHFNDSMIGTTPRKTGDDSDPRLPLNYGHGEQDVSDHSQSHIPTIPGQEHTYAPSDLVSGFTSLSAAGSSNTANPLLQVPDTTDAWAPTSYPKPESEDNSHLHTSCLTNTTDVTYHQTPLNSFRGGADAMDTQMLEIDWDLWDTIFLPRTNDGNLDISDGFMWESQVPYNHVPAGPSF